MSEQMPNQNQVTSQSSSLPYAPGAVASLVLGIISLVTMSCLGIGLIPGIIAVVLGSKGRKAVAANPTSYQGGGMATAGFVMGIIGIILSVLMLLFWIVYILIFAAIFSHQFGEFNNLFFDR